MHSRILAVAVALGGMVSSRPLLAQYILSPQMPPLTVATTVTFTIPLKLTQLSPDVEKVGVFCLVGGDGLLRPSWASGVTMDLLPKDEMPVVTGQLVATMSVLVPIYAELLQNPTGKTADYQCWLAGFSKSLQSWQEFSETSTVPAFVVKPTPAPIRGTFIW